MSGDAVMFWGIATGIVLAWAFVASSDAVAYILHRRGQERRRREREAKRKAEREALIKTLWGNNDDA